MTLLSRLLGVAALGFLGLIGCGSSNSSTSPQGTVIVSVSDASAAENWATIGVKLLSVALTPQNGSAPVTVYTAPTPVPVINLVQLDDLSELLGRTTVPVGAYTGAILTISANQGDVVLRSASNPEAGFPETGEISSSKIKIHGAKGAKKTKFGNKAAKVVEVEVKFQSPLTVAMGQTLPVELEFDVTHPAFIVSHGNGANTQWHIRFNGPIRHRVVNDITRTVLRQQFGQVTGVSTDKLSLTVNRAYPAVSNGSATAQFSGQSLTLQVDTANGTLFYDVDYPANNPASAIKDFSPVSSLLADKYIRYTARYQSNGTLVAVRIWVSSTFNKLWLSPEGHVLHVQTGETPSLVLQQDGSTVGFVVNAGTKIFVRRPEDPAKEVVAVNQNGDAFVNAGKIKRGFKVHATPVDPTADPLIAQSLEIEKAIYEGAITAATSDQFTFARAFATSTDNYTKTLNYLGDTIPNGKAADGSAINGFKWWYFAYPTLVHYGSNAKIDFVTAANPTITFGGITYNSKGISECRWNDTLSDWDANFAVLQPIKLPIGKVSIALNDVDHSFGMDPLSGSGTLTVYLSITPGSATDVYKVDRTGNVVTLTPLDITNPADLATLKGGLVASTTKVKAFGIPRTDHYLNTYTLFYYTGDTAP